MTIGAIINLSDFLYENVIINDLYIGGFLDLTKAFDTVNHYILLCCYDVTNVTLEILESYLLKEKQKLRFVKDFSNYINVAFVVPQGRVFSLLLFLIYINDIFKTFNSDKTLLCKYQTMLQIKKNFYYI